MAVLIRRTSSKLRIRISKEKQNSKQSGFQSIYFFSFIYIAYSATSFHFLRDDWRSFSFKFSGRTKLFIIELHSLKIFWKSIFSSAATRFANATINWNISMKKKKVFFTLFAFFENIVEKVDWKAFSKSKEEEGYFRKIHVQWFLRLVHRENRYISEAHK